MFQKQRTLACPNMDEGILIYVFLLCTQPCPRRRGKKISLSKVKKGDLLFFKTNKSSRNINHVGLVTSVKKGQIRFIHATSSKGVIVSVLSQKYWKNTFVKAVKIL